MARKLDFSALTRAERAVLATGTLLFVNGFVPWWYRTSHGTYGAGLTGWGTLAAASGAAAAVTVLARAWIWPQPAPKVDGSVYTALGVAGFTAALVQIARADAAWIGLWVALALAAALTAAGLRRRAERHAGWT